MIHLGNPSPLGGLDDPMDPSPLGGLDDPRDPSPLGGNPQGEIHELSSMICVYSSLSSK